MQTSLVKVAPIRSDRLTQAACGESCVRCGCRDGTIVAAHYTGPRSATFGKGRGIKPHDICVAHLCRACHATMDANENHDDRWMRSEEFLFLCMLTVVRLIKNETLKA